MKNNTIHRYVVLYKRD